MRSEMNVGCTMSRKKLISVLKDQRKEYASAYRKAMNNWRKLMKREAQKILDTPSKKLKEFPKGLFQAHRLPMSYVNQIDEVISMLKDSAEKDIQLDQRDYCKLVLGQWDWAADVKMSNVWYANALK